MSINSPRLPGPYAERLTDCQNAIERDFLRQVVECNTPFVDADRILSAIAEDAAEAGWNEEEISTAVQFLARRHKMATARLF